MINFPIKKTAQFVPINKQVTNSKARLGMLFEEMINASNQFYLAKGIAVIHKKPTPVKIVKVDYPSRQHARIVEAYYTVPSTTDYNGIYRGKYIDFEAKETSSTTSFSLRNIHEHQVRHLADITLQGGIGFLLVHFTSKQETYLLPYSILKEYWEGAKHGERKSIPYQVFVTRCTSVKHGFQPQVEYIKAIDEIYF